MALINLTTPFEECDFTKCLIDCIQLRTKTKNKYIFLKPDKVVL